MSTNVVALGYLAIVKNVRSLDDYTFMSQTPYTWPKELAFISAFLCGQAKTLRVDMWISKYSDTCGRVLSRVFTDDDRKCTANFLHLPLYQRIEFSGPKRIQLYFVQGTLYLFWLGLEAHNILSTREVIMLLEKKITVWLGLFLACIAGTFVRCANVFEDLRRL